MESNHFDLKAKRRMLYKRKKIRKLLKLSLTSFFSLAIVIAMVYLISLTGQSLGQRSPRRSARCPFPNTQAGWFACYRPSRAIGGNHWHAVYPAGYPTLPDCSGNSAVSPAFQRYASAPYSYYRFPYP